jgi:ATP-dependent helicase HrpB
MKTVQRLPIDPLIAEIVRSVELNPITLLQADPGAGKTTRAPPALAGAGLSGIYVLEARRLAARRARRWGNCPSIRAWRVLYSKQR